MIYRAIVLPAVALLALLATPPARAEEPLTYNLIIKNHRFEPAEIKAPAGKKLKLVVKNEDSTAEEFESHDLHREKIIAGGAEATFTLRPLDKGTYVFFGEFNPETAQGKLIVE